MSKNLWLIVTAIVIVLASITLIALLILIPQKNATQGTAGKEYDKISKQEYIYTPTKGITEEALVEEYTIGAEAIREGKADKIYVPGNTDPFTAASTETPATNSNPNPAGTAAPADAANK